MLLEGAVMYLLRTGGSGYANNKAGVERFVVVDFDMEQVHEKQETVEHRAWQDWAFFRNAFNV